MLVTFACTESTLALIVFVEVVSVVTLDCTVLMLVTAVPTLDCTESTLALIVFVDVVRAVTFDCTESTLALIVLVEVVSVPTLDCTEFIAAVMLEVLVSIEVVALSELVIVRAPPTSESLTDPRYTVPGPT